MKVAQLKQILSSLDDNTPVNVDFIHFENDSLTLGHCEPKQKEEEEEWDSWDDVRDGDHVKVIPLHAHSSAVIAGKIYDGSITQKGNHIFDEDEYIPHRLDRVKILRDE